MMRFISYDLMLFPFLLSGMEKIQNIPPTLTELCLAQFRENQNLDIAVLSADCHYLLLDSIKTKLYVKTPQETKALLNRAAAYAPHYIPLVLHLNSLSTDKFINDDAAKQIHRAVRFPTRWHLRTPFLEALAKLPKNSSITAEQTIRGLQALLQAGASVNGNPKIQHGSPLSYSILYHPEEVTLFLLEQSDVDIDSYNPLVLAIQKNKIAVVRKLLEKGARPNGPHNTGSPLNQAVRNNYFEIAQLLLVHGANANKGALPLAIQNNNFALTKLLLDYKADPRKQHKIDSLELLLFSPNKEIQALLQEHLAHNRSPKKRRLYKNRR